MIISTVSDLFLDKVIPLLSYLRQKIKDVDVSSEVHSSDHAVDDNVCSTSTNTSAETEMVSV